jgi:cytochrome c biogenesis protein CcdA
MFLVDFIVISYYILFRKAKQNGLKGSLYLATAFPLMFIIFYLSIYFINLLIPLKDVLNPILVGGLLILIGFSIKFYLNKRYMSKKEWLDVTCDKYVKYRFVFIPIVLLYYIFSIYILFYSFRII